MALQIEIHMLDMYRSLGAGRRFVTYLGFRDGFLLCADTLGRRVRVPRAKFRLVAVGGQPARATEDGHVEVRVGDEWRTLDLPSDGKEPAAGSTGR